MSATYQFIRGNLYPTDPLRGVVYGTEPIQKILDVVQDEYFIDSVTGANLSRIICVTVAGTVTMEFKDGSQVTQYMNAGIYYPVYVNKILSAGTSATGIQWGY